MEIKGPVESISMQPNGAGSLGIGFNYKSIGLGFSVGLPTTDESNEKYGQTRRFDLQISYYGTKIAADGYFQEYEGYYLANPGSVTNWNNANYPQSADLRVVSLGGTIHYIFNSDKYSYKAAYLRNQIQKKSAVSCSSRRQTHDAGQPPRSHIRHGDRLRPPPPGRHAAGSRVRDSAAPGPCTTVSSPEPAV